MPAKRNAAAAPAIEIHPLTPERWADLERLFGPRGACAGCWCMYWRLARGESRHRTGEDNRRALAALVRAGRVPGLLGYADGEPVAWCALGPREDFGRIERSPRLRRIDDARTWSVPCFFVARPYRGRGLLVPLLEAAAAYARAGGADYLEGYPIDPGGEHVAPANAYTGLVSAFRRAGFRKVTRRVEGKAISRYRRAL